MPRRLTQLDNDIAEALQRLGSETRAAQFDMSGYIAAFQGSAIEKARTVLNLLGKEPPFEGCRPAFLSIGGGDGEELRHLLQGSTATLGVLIEGAQALAKRALELRSHLPGGKRMEVFEGDAQQQLRRALELVRREVVEGRADYLAITCHAVIHELFDRGQDQFDPLGFFAAMFDDTEIATWFTYREPGEPEKWPKSVLIQADCTPQSLLRLAQAIAQRHPNIAQQRPEPQVVGDYVRLHRIAAMELLAKLFYLSDLSHEIQERATAVDHTRMINCLMLAIGEEKENKQWAKSYTISEPTKSFREHWEAKKVHILGLDDQERQIRLGVPESQTRVIAWRQSSRLHGASPPTAAAPVLSNPPPDPAVTVAEQAYHTRDLELLDAILVSRGRWWIESSCRDKAMALLETVRQNSPPDSLAHLWSHYLLAVSSLFREPRDVPTDAFSEDKVRAASVIGLGEVFQAERMESARKHSDYRTALEIANNLRQVIMRQVGGEPTARKQSALDKLLGLLRSRKRAEAQPRIGSAMQDGGLRRYSRGTSMYLLANFLRSGGRYDLAVEWVARAEATYQRGISSHDTELAHCHYARQVCTAVMGSSAFDPPKDEAELLSKRFSGGLIILSYSHAAWFLGDLPRAIDHAERAARAFAEVGADRYIERARQLQNLLHIWQALDANTQPSFDGVEPRLAEGIRYFSGLQPSWVGLPDWLKEQRPSRAVGLLQFASRTQQIWQATQPLRLPYTIQILRDGTWQWGDEKWVHSLAEADEALRQIMSIPSNQRIPLIAD